MAEKAKNIEPVKGLTKERAVMKVAEIDLNEGQWPWLPKNPRSWTKEDIEKTVASIREDPDFLEDRPILVIPSPAPGRYIAFCGNLRLTACRFNDMATVPVVVYHILEAGVLTEEEKLEQAVIRELIKRRAMKDNGSFGSWAWDELGNNWDDLPLTDWGVPAWPQNEEHQGEAPASSSSSSGSGSEGAGSPDDYGTEFNLPDGERAAFQQMSFTLADEQVAEVKEAIKQAKELEEFKTNINYGNENGNGNALALIIEQWLQQRTS